MQVIQDAIQDIIHSFKNDLGETRQKLADYVYSYFVSLLIGEDKELAKQIAVAAATITSTSPDVTQLRYINLLLQAPDPAIIQIDMLLKQVANGKEFSKINLQKIDDDDDFIIIESSDKEIIRKSNSLIDTRSSLVASEELDTSHYVSPASSTSSLTASFYPTTSMTMNTVTTSSIFSTVSAMMTGTNKKMKIAKEKEDNSSAYDCDYSSNPSSAPSNNTMFGEFTNQWKQCPPKNKADVLKLTKAFFDVKSPIYNGRSKEEVITIFHSMKQSLSSWIKESGSKLPQNTYQDMCKLINDSIVTLHRQIMINDLIKLNGFSPIETREKLVNKIKNYLSSLEKCEDKNIIKTLADTFLNHIKMREKEERYLPIIQFYSTNTDRFLAPRIPILTKEIIYIKEMLEAMKNGKCISKIAAFKNEYTLSDVSTISYEDVEKYVDNKLEATGCISAIKAIIIELIVIGQVYAPNDVQAGQQAAMQYLAKKQEVFTTLPSDSKPKVLELLKRLSRHPGETEVIPATHPLDHALRYLRAVIPGMFETFSDVAGKYTDNTTVFQTLTSFLAPPKVSNNSVFTEKVPPPSSENDPRNKYGMGYGSNL